MLEKVHRIQRGHLEVWCGMIMGFDHDDETIFDRQIEFIQQARISFAMSGMLSAIPQTPLHARLAAEGRLDLNDDNECGTNVIPLLLSREELRDGFLRVLSRQYEPQAYFARTEALFLDPAFEIGNARSSYWRKHRLRKFADECVLLVQAVGFWFRLMRGVPEAHLRREYRRRLLRMLKVHQRPGLVLFYIFHLAMHYHAHTMAINMAARRTGVVNTF
jgi:hypothetical protein